MKKLLIGLIIGLIVIWGCTQTNTPLTQDDEIAELIKRLKDEEVCSRSKSAVVLGEIKNISASVKPLIEVLKNKGEDAIIRCWSAKVLGKIGHKAAVQPLIESLKDETKSVRFEATRALEYIKDKSSVKPLIEALKDENKEVRWSAANALRAIGDKTAIKPLIEALKEETLGENDKNVLCWIANAIEQLTKQKFGYDYDKWMEWYNKNKTTEDTEK